MPDDALPPLEMRAPGAAGTGARSLPATYSVLSIAPPGLQDGRMLVLRAYGWLFLVAGVAFVGWPGQVLALLAWAAEILPGARPLPGGAPSLWLGLAGAAMAVIAHASFALARAPEQRLGWNVLLLSKATSTLLFSVFAATSTNSLFLVGSLVDGAILVHLSWLRRRLVGPAALVDAWRPRMPRAARRWYEVWFLELDDPSTGNALWLRYTWHRDAAGTRSACWYVLFDAGRGEVKSGRWEEPAGERPPADGAEILALSSASLARRRARAEHADVRWDLSWEPLRAAPLALVPRMLFDLGIAGSLYAVPLAAGRFAGELELEGRRYHFDRAPGAAGHIWGMRMADRWRWAHAALRTDGGEAGADEEIVFEILSAQARLGPLRSPRLTFAYLWQGDRARVANGLVAALRRNRISSDGAGWSFTADFGDLVARGRCALAAELTAELDYRDPGGRRLRCRHSRTGTMHLVLERRGEPARSYTAEGTAAVETVESP